MFRAAISAGLVLASSAGQAASLQSFATVCRHPWDADNHPYCETDAGTESALAETLFGTPGVTYSIHSVASAGASYGSVAVSGVYDALRGTEDVFVRYFNSTRSVATPAAASARFQDTWTVGGGLSGAGTISITFAVSGFYSSGCDLPCAADFPFVPAVAGASFSGGSPTGPPPLYGMAGEVYNVGGASPPLSLGGTYTAGPIPITAGVPFPVLAAMDLFALAPRLDDLPPIGIFHSSGVMDFANTAVLTSIEVRDAAGKPVPDFTLMTESGATYGVPEPAAVLLLAAGGTVLAALRRRGGGTMSDPGSRKSRGRAAAVASLVVAVLAAPMAALAKDFCFHTTADGGWSIVMHKAKAKAGASGAVDGYAVRDDGQVNSISGGYTALSGGFLLGLTRYAAGQNLISEVAALASETSFHQASVPFVDPSQATGFDYMWTKEENGTLTSQSGTTTRFDCTEVPKLPK